MKVVMVGAGNTATVLSAKIQNAGHEIVQVISRSLQHAKELASIYNASFAELSQNPLADADIYIIALNDSSLENIEKIASFKNTSSFKNKLVVHTAGAISINALKNFSATYGVLYPLQTLSKLYNQLPEIPFLVDGDSDETRERISEFAKSLSDKVIEASDAERLHYHVAAVFVNNFSNHMYALAELFCQKESLEFNTLLPLIDETTKKVNQFSPYLTQTGPAIRDDVYTLNRHLQALSAHPNLKYIYLKLSESIIKTHGKR